MISSQITQKSKNGVDPKDLLHLEVQVVHVHVRPSTVVLPIVGTQHVRIRMRMWLYEPSLKRRRAIALTGRAPPTDVQAWHCADFQRELGWVPSSEPRQR